MSRSELKTQINDLIGEIKNNGRYGNTERSVLSNCCAEELQRADIRSYAQFENEMNRGMIDIRDLEAIRNKLRQISQMNGGKKRRMKKSRKMRKTKKAKKTKGRKSRKSRKTRRH